MFAFEPPQQQNQSSHLVSPAAGQRVVRLFSEADYSPDLESGLGNQMMQRMLQAHLIQAKLTISQPGDKEEREADRVADEVMRMPERNFQTPIQLQGKKKHQKDLQSRFFIAPVIQLKKFPNTEEKTLLQTKLFCSFIQREKTKKEKTWERKDKSRTFQAEFSLLRSAETWPQFIDNLEEPLSISDEGGHPLPAEILAFMEPRFGVKFNHVRVHTGSDAVRLNQALNAQAFTHGWNIYFSSGKYAPGCHTGKELLAHELTHVVQQIGHFHRKRDATKKDSEELRRVQTLSEKYRAAVEEARKGDNTKWFEAAILLNGFNISDIFSSLNELSPADRTQMRDNAGWVTRVSESIDLLSKGLSEGRTFNEIKEEAFKSEKTRFKELEKNYQRAIKAKAWSEIALFLNAFSPDDILLRLSRLKKPEIAAIYKGAIENPRVGPNSNIALIIIGQYTTGVLPDLPNIKDLEKVQKAINEKDYQKALDLLVPSLPIDTSLLMGGKIFVNKLAPVQSWEELSGLSTPFPSPKNRTGPTKVEIFIPTFIRGISFLYTTIMHEYQHVRQFHSRKRSEAEEEVEAHAWEIIHSEQTKFFEIKPGQYEIKSKGINFRTPIELMWYRLDNIYWSRLNKNKKKPLNHLYIMAHTVAMRADPESIIIKNFYSPLSP